MFKKISNMINGISGTAVDYFVYRTETGVSKITQYLAKQRVRRLGGVRHPGDWLLLGRLDKYAESAFGVKHNEDGTVNHTESTYPWLAVAVPEDLRRPYYWDGRLPNGDMAYKVGFRHITAQDGQLIRRKASTHGLKSGVLLAAITFALSLGTSLDNLGIGWPGWNLGWWVFDLPVATMLHAITSEAVVWTADAVGKLLELAVTGMGTVVACATLAAAVFAVRASVSTTTSLSSLLSALKDWYTRDLAKPSQDALLLWKNRARERALDMKVYAEAVIDAVTRRAHLPTIRAGIATGLLRSRGLDTAPEKGQWMAWDGESLRAHALIFGETGTGKTLRGIRPIFREIMAANWGEDHLMGAVIFDGKGELPFDLRKEIPAHRLKDFALVGTEDGAFGLDLLAGMDPVEIADAFTMVAIQVNGAGGEDGTKWINGAAEAIKHAAFMARFVAERTDAESTIWGRRKYRPYSLLGLMAISTEDSLNLGIAGAILTAEEQGKTVESEAAEAARFFAEVWKTYAPETRSSYSSNITDTLGKLSGTKKLAERFASGKIDDVPMIDVDEALENGRIIAIGLSEVEDGIPGLIVANWIKSRLYLLAQRRVTRSAKAREILERVRDCIENYDSLQFRSAKLYKLKTRLDRVADGNNEAFAEASSLFNDLFPNEPENGIGDLSRMKRILRGETEGVETRLQGFTEEVRLLAFPARGEEATARARIEQLEWEAVMTKKRSCVCVIDEYQNFATVGGGGKADSSFLNVARATGLFVIAATQSIDALVMKVGYANAMNILNCFTSKMFFHTSDTSTHEYIVKIAGEGFQSMTYARNLESNYSRVLEKARDERIDPAKLQELNIKRVNLLPNLGTLINDDDVFHAEIEEVDVGARQNVEWAVKKHGEDRQPELRRHTIEKEDAIKGEIKDGSIRPYVSVTDIENLTEGHAFCIINRAGMIRKDFAYFPIDRDNFRAT